MKIFGGFLTILFGIPLILFLTSFIDAAPEQDRCEFGPVSNLEYRKLLARAKAQDWTVWPGLSNGMFWESDRWIYLPSEKFKHSIERALLNSIQSLLAAESSIETKLAGAHAVMRAMGATYYNSIIIPERLSGTAPPTTEVRFNYVFPQRRFAPLCVTCYFFRTTTIHVIFRHSSHNNVSELDQVVVLFSDLKRSPDLPSALAQVCPSSSDLEALNSGRR